MSGLFGSTTIKGNQITDFADQTSTVGIPIPFGYGTFQVDGNVIWISDVTTHVTKKKQGKGGVKTEEYTYTRSYAIAFCEGQIYGYLTITRNGKVVYTTDPNAAVEDRDYAAKWAQKATFYFGTRTQMPDSTIEAKEGAGQVSAFRDLAYIVVENDDVTDGAGAVPSYQAIVVATPPEVYMTSRPYALELESDVTSGADFNLIRNEQQPFAWSNINLSADVLDIQVFGGSQSYTFSPIDNVMPVADILDIQVFGGSKAYSYVPEEKVSTTADILDIQVFGGSVNYSIADRDVNNVKVSADIVDITLG